MITKKQSKMLQGIAIVLMIYHHFFSIPQMNPVTYLNIDIAQKLAWFSKICVSIFSFVSGYGMCIILSKARTKNGSVTLLDQYKIVFKRFLKLLYKYWIIVVLNTIISVFYFKVTVTFIDILKNAFLIDFTFDGAWWFMREYLFFILIAPVIEQIIVRIKKGGNQKRNACILSIVLLTLMIISKVFISGMDAFFNVIQPIFILTFLVGYILKEYEVFEKIDRVISANEAINRIIGLIIIVLVLFVRISITTDASYAKLDFVIAPVFCMGFLLLVRNTKILSKGFVILGNNATFMWLIHLVVDMLTKKFVFLISSNSLIYYVCEVAICLSVAWILNKIFNSLAIFVKKTAII